MDVASVTLDEVLRAARARSAALVPETSGYLALAIGDASARLPYRIEDHLVTLTTEGTVRVARGKEGVTPEEGARVLRDHLHRLLSVSGGSMPGLAHAGAPRREVGGPDTVVAEIESALIPCNRAAARRSLARLARDTARARDAGRLAPHAPPISRGMGTASEARPVHRPSPAAEPAPPSYPRAQHVGAPPTQPAYTQPAYAPPTYAPPTYAQHMYMQPMQPAYAQPQPDVQAHVAYERYAQPSAAAYAPAYAPPQQPAQVAYIPVPAAYAPLPAYAAPAAEAYAPPQDAELPTPATAAPYPHAPSYAEIAVAPPVFEVDVDIEDPASAEVQPSPEDMTHRLDVAALGFEATDATTIDAVEVIEASFRPHSDLRPSVDPAPAPHASELDRQPAWHERFQRIEDALIRDADVKPDADATPRLGTGWPTHAPQPAGFDRALGDHVAAALASPAPSAVVIASRVDDAARSLEAALDAGRLATPRPRLAEPPLRMRRLPWQADLGRARKSDVSELLARFGASDPQRDATTMRRDIKRTIGIDATQLPPRVATRDR